MDYVNLSASLTMLELVRFLLQDRNDSFSFYSGKLGNLKHFEENSVNYKKVTDLCQYICKKVREVWSVHNIGIIAVNDEVMICVTSPDPSVPGEAVSFMVEAVAVCLVDLLAEKSKVTDDDQKHQVMMDEDVSPDLVQVNASMKEINERIEQFIRYKREQADANNVLDFCGPSDDRQFCARVDAVLVRKKDSSSHMAVRNVLDRYTAKHNTKKQDKIELLPSARNTSQESASHGQIQSPSSVLQQTADMSHQKGEKRKFDVASLESMLNSVKKQQNV